MMIDSVLCPEEPGFGVDQVEKPRLVVEDERAQLLGSWADTGSGAFARKSSDGFTSVFVGTAPVPVHTLRRLCVDAGVRLWSSQPDIVLASKDWGMLVSTSEGERRLRLHRSLSSLDDEASGSEFLLDLHEGEVRLFGVPEIVGRISRPLRS
jgi:hypothetical protein